MGDSKQVSRIVMIVLVLFLAVRFFTGLYRLGSLKAYETLWCPGAANEYALLDTGRVQPLNAVAWFSGPGYGKYHLFFSRDKKTWSSKTVIEEKPFAWQAVRVDRVARYVFVRCVKPGGGMFELQLGTDSRPGQPKAEFKHQLVPARSTQSALTDESVEFTVPSYFNSAYFDEEYYVQSAFQILHHDKPYENTHPPLGKLVIAAFIAAGGNSPFFWRLPGLLCGFAAIAVVFLLMKLFFNDTLYALFAAGIIAFCPILFTLSRMATLDMYVAFLILLVVFLLFKSISIDTRRTMVLSLELFLLTAAVSGLTAAVKWNGLFILPIIPLYAVLCYATAKKKGETPVVELHLFGSRIRSERGFPISILLAFFLFFIAAFSAYFAAFIPRVLAAHASVWKGFWQEQMVILSYHTFITESHFYSSGPWTWPFMLKPVWVYKGRFLIKTLASSIAVVGNPVFGVLAPAGAAAAVISAIIKRKARLLAIGCGAFLVYVPWFFIGRISFLYHYLPCMLLGLCAFFAFFGLLQTENRFCITAS